MYIWIHQEQTIKNKPIMKEVYWKYSLIILILFLGILLFQQAQPFMNGILGAFTLYLLLRKVTFRLAEKIKYSKAVWLVTIGTLLFIIIPVSLLSWLLVSEISNLNIHPKELIRPVLATVDFIKAKTGIDILSESTLTFVAGKIPAIGQSIMSGVSDFFINVAVAIMLLYFLLSGGRQMENYISTLLPFKEKGKREVLQQIHVIVRSNAIGIPLLALIQGCISLLGYWICGVPNLLLAALFTAIASIIPIVGTALIWIPMAAYLAIIGEWGMALVLLAYGGIVISQSDNLIRFILQKKMADIHPLITIFGVVAGLPLFGFMGVIFGPLLVSLFLVFLEMFRKEYLLDPDQ